MLQSAARRGRTIGSIADAPRNTCPWPCSGELGWDVRSVHGGPTLRDAGTSTRAVSGGPREGRGRAAWSCSTLRACSASSCTSTSCRASTTGRPILRPRSSLPARPCATARDLVTCTPHAALASTWPRSPSAGQRAAGRARIGAQIDLEVRTGAELSWYDVPELGEAELSRIIAQGPRLPPLAAARGAAGRGRGTLQELETASAQELRDRGFGLLIGHPERSPALVGDGPGAVEELLEAGDRLQLNGSSLTGYPRRPRPGRGARARRRRGARRWWPPTRIGPASACRA